MKVSTKGLAALTALSAREAERRLLTCCGSRAWARRMVKARPFVNLPRLLAEADSVWRRLGRRDWLEAFAGHPKIGANISRQSSVAGRQSRVASRQSVARRRPSVAGRQAQVLSRQSVVSRQSRDAGWSAQEQSGVETVSSETLRMLARLNLAYEARFGYIFIVCAAGKSADELLALLESRMRHSPGKELHAAAEEQRKITRLRLRKLIDGLTDDRRLTTDD